MSVHDLKAKLNRLGLPQGGRKAELEARLRGAEAFEASLNGTSDDE
jgi:hypothetical protein